ncbi:restriction endonuclease subunit S [Muricauda oceani]|uniref:Type I restriction modification DNA specificity domain-containing protein n=2 Tax=Flagellimonas oceani TaxID=2698672 RepID=A0A6G7J081_9FLAO|nr:restriction endonuclease subunit S [Allomuricauda oceani]MBW8244837.1 restriction endonuclease subunit S [Allomuricauda oceani]QII43852.1 hypothetical protein GVT53_03900 [Allomuricauda oceani]
MNKKIPESWIYVKLDEVIIYGKGKKPKVLRNKNFKDSIPYLDIKAIETGNIDRWADKFSSRITSSEELVLVWDGSRSGWVGLSKDGALGSTLVAIKPVVINKTYLFYFLKSKFKYLNQNTKGVGIPHVDSIVFSNLKFPLAPLIIQKKIAKRIDLLFTKLDKSKSSLLKITNLIEDFKNIVLNGTLSGSLISEEVAYSEYHVEDLIHGLKYGTSKKSDYDNKGTPVLRIPNLVNFALDQSDLKFSSLTDTEIKNYYLKEGDLLLIRSNGSLNLLGRTSIVSKEFEGMCYAGYLIRIRPKADIIDSKFLNYAFHSKFVRDQIVGTSRSTSGVNNINSKEINRIKILIPPMGIQKKLVTKIETLLKSIDRAYSESLKIKDKVELLYQSILDKAFSGDLIKTKDVEGFSKDLLKQIKREKELVLSKEKERKRLINRTKKEKRKLMDILEILQAHNSRMKTKELWEKSKYKDDIDAFYAALKQEVNQNKIKESKDKEYLEIV